MKKRNMNRKGFTLAEEVITVLLIGILVVSASGILMNAMRIFSMNVISLNAQAKGIAVMDELVDHLTYAKSIGKASSSTGFMNPTDNSYQVILYIDKDSSNGKNYLYSSTSTKHSASDTAGSTAPKNKLCVLSAFEAVYTVDISATNKKYAIINLQIQRNGKAWYSEERTVELKNEPSVGDSDFSFDSTTDKFLYIGSIE